MMTVPIAIFLISAAALGLELVLVRALSIGHWHHFSYLVISTALLGFGAGGTFVAVGSKFLTAHYKRAMWWFAIGLGLAVPMVFWLSQKVPFDELQLTWDRRQIVHLFAYYILFFIPFFFAAGSVALAFTVFSDKAHRLYFYNMTGSGLGAAAAVALMHGNSPERLLMVISGAAFFAALVLAFGVSRGRIAGTIVVAVVCLFSFSAAGPFALEINISEHKSLVWYRELPEAEVSATRYSPLGRLDCVEAPTVRVFSGLSMAYQGGLPRQMVIISDGDGVSAVNHFEDFNELDCYDYMTSALAYHLVGEPSVCVIGAGGGSDVCQALALGAEKVRAVEMNQQIVDLVRDRFDEFASRLYRRDDVAVVISEGRSFLQTTGRRFDIISISLLDSLGASAAGQHALNESHLYTVEAIERALAKLRPNGLLSITRALKTPPRDSLKMLATVAEALRRLGKAAPAEHIIMIRSWATATIVASRQALSRAQIEAARSFAEQRSFDMVHFGGIKAGDANRFHVLGAGAIYYDSAQEILSGECERFYSDYAYNIRPATDDRPYFFDFFKLKSLPHMRRTLGRRQWLRFSEWGYLILAATLVQAVFASGSLILLPLVVSKPIRGVRSRKLATMVYFLLLGLGYMFLEMGFIQKLTLLIGHPVLGVAVTLSGFLLFSGCGSLVCGRLLSCRGATGIMIPIAASAIIIVGLAEMAGLRFCFDWLVGFSRPVRMLLGFLITGPLAFFMGMPFPSGLRQLHHHCRPLVPWAWGINGFASVTGAVLGTILAISVGFTALAGMALACYLLASIVSRQLSH
jgi:spermidine synthase